MADTVHDHFQRIPYRPAVDGKVEIHSGSSRHYPTLHGNLVTAEGISARTAVLMAHPASNFLSHFLLGAFAAAGVPIMAMNTRYAANAQLRRIRRIDAWAQEQLARSAGRPGADRAFVVHRTVADPRFVDVTIDPSDREPGSLYGDPRAANWAAGGLARFVTARSWLSTWSEEHTHASAPSDLAGVKAPPLVMALRGDQAAFVGESREMHAASADPHAELIEMPHLTHYLVDQPEGLGQIIEHSRSWLVRRELVG